MLTALLHSKNLSRPWKQDNRQGKRTTPNSWKESKNLKRNSPVFSQALSLCSKYRWILLCKRQVPVKQVHKFLYDTKQCCLQQQYVDVLPQYKCITNNFMHKNSILLENSVAPIKQVKAEQANKRNKKHIRLAVTSSNLLLSHKHMWIFLVLLWYWI